MAVDRPAGYGLTPPGQPLPQAETLGRTPAPVVKAAGGRLFGALAWCALLLGPLLAWLVVFALGAQDQCGPWGLGCVARAILYSAASWVFGTLLATVALLRGERRGLAVPALVLNLVPLLGLLAAYVFLIGQA